MRAFRHIISSPLTGVAALSAILLVGVVLWQSTAGLRPVSYKAPSTTDEETRKLDPLWEQEMMLLGLATSSGTLANNGEDPIALIGPQITAQLLGTYTSLVDSGTYSPEAGTQAAAAIASNMRALVPYTPHTKAELKTTEDTSYARVMTYRDDAQKALQPLLSNTRAEYEIYAAYIETGDAAELVELQRVAKNYADAADSMMKVTVPSDAVTMHLSIVNALGRFSENLKSMAQHVDDPLASAALLRTYNDSELAVVTSFDTFAKYAKSKMP